jgi:L-ascorbate metabolism protein UlaG (beta-lactamase superfamily)
VPVEQLRACLPDAGVDLSRRVPILIPPEELNVDVYACTHNHLDHTDPVTIGGLRNKDTAQFIGPHPSCEVYRAQGIETGRIVPAGLKRKGEVCAPPVTGFEGPRVP